MKNSKGVLVFHKNRFLCPSWTNTLQNFLTCLVRRVQRLVKTSIGVIGTDTGFKYLCGEEERRGSEMPHWIHGREWAKADLWLLWKNREQCLWRLENAQYADICLPCSRCGGHHHWGHPCAYSSWKPRQGYELAVSTTTQQNISGVSKTFCGTWHTASKVFLLIHDTKTSELVN